MAILSTGIDKIDLKVEKNTAKSIKDLNDSILLATKLSLVLKQALTTATTFGYDLIWTFEIPIGSQSARAARLLGMSTGVLSSAISELKRYNSEFYCRPITVKVVKPSELKAHVGNKKATKKDIMSYVNKKYKNIQADYPENKFEHIADSIVMAEIITKKLKDNNNEGFEIII